MVFSLALKDDMLINQAVILLPSNQQTRTRLKFTILFSIAHRLVFTTLHGKVIVFLGTCTRKQLPRATRRLTGPHTHFLLACRDGHLPSGLCLACRDGHLPSGLCLACRDGHLPTGLCLVCRDGHLPSGLCLACRDGHLPSGLCLVCRDGHLSSGSVPGMP